MTSLDARWTAESHETVLAELRSNIQSLANSRSLQGGRPRRSRDATMKPRKLQKSARCNMVDTLVENVETARQYSSTTQRRHLNFAQDRSVATIQGERQREVQDHSDLRPSPARNSFRREASQSRTREACDPRLPTQNSQEEAAYDGVLPHAPTSFRTS